MMLALREIAAASGGSLLSGSPDLLVRSISIDSRTVAPGDLFFAIIGPRFNAHDFVLQALEHGALGAVVSELRGEYRERGSALLLVDDTTRALQETAALVRSRWPGTVIGITGSTGKTTTKEFTAGLLDGSFRVLKSRGNLNNLYGLPLSLWALGAEHQVAVLEMAMSRRGEIARLAEIARPQIGIYTNIAPVHLEFFESLEDIARAKGEMLDYIGREGTVIYNADDPLLVRLVADFRGEKISYGLQAQADVRGGEVRCDLDGSRFLLQAAGTRRWAWLPLIGRHNIYNVLAATAAALRLGVDPDLIIARMQHLEPAPMRGQTLRFAEGFVLIDDSYNSNPRALKEMVAALSELPGFSRRIVVAGEMLELGAESARLHEECGRFLAAHSIDLLITVQGQARHIGLGARGSLGEEKQRFFERGEEAAEFLCSQLRAGDLVLVKGSRGVGLEKVVRAVAQTFRLVQGEAERPERRADKN